MVDHVQHTDGFIDSLKHMGHAMAKSVFDHPLEGDTTDIEASVNSILGSTIVDANRWNWREYPSKHVGKHWVLTHKLDEDHEYTRTIKLIVTRSKKFHAKDIKGPFNITVRFERMSTTTNKRVNKDDSSRKTNISSDNFSDVLTRMLKKKMQKAEVDP